MALIGWTKKAPLTFGKSTGGLSCVLPVTRLNAPAAFISGCKADGGDIRFATDANGDNLLPFELLKLTKTPETLLIYLRVNIPADNTVIWVFWGNPDAQMPAYDPWVDFYGVLSFAQTPGGANAWKTALDSAGRYNAATQYGAPTTTPSPLSGINAWLLDSTLGNFVQLNELITLAGPFYMEFWMHHQNASPGAGSANILAPKDYYSGFGTTGVGITESGSGAPQLTLRDTVVGAVSWPAGTGKTWNQWHHYAFWRDSSNNCTFSSDKVSVTKASFTAVPDALNWLPGNSATFVQYAVPKAAIFGLKFTRGTLPVAAASMKAYADAQFDYHYSNGSLITPGTTQTITAPPVTVSLTAVTASGVPVAGVQVRVNATGAGPLGTISNATIVNSGTTATVTTNADHPFESGDKVLIKGANRQPNNGVFTITKTGAKTFTYVMASAPGSNPAAGFTISFLALFGTTDANGMISMSRVFTGNQPVIGVARKSSGAPLYKSSPLAGTISSNTGVALTAIMLPD
jgi:hypothetical protein